MKIRVEFDVSPDEMRALFGLPDVKPLQDDLLSKVREGIESGSAGIDAVGLMRPFLAPNMQAMEGLQRAFWQAVTQANANVWGAATGGERQAAEDERQS